MYFDINKILNFFVSTSFSPAMSSTAWSLSITNYRTSLAQHILYLPRYSKLCIYVFIYICMCLCVYMYVCMYVCIGRFCKRSLAPSIGWFINGAIAISTVRLAGTVAVLISKAAKIVFFSSNEARPRVFLFSILFFLFFYSFLKWHFVQTVFIG